MITEQVKRRTPELDKVHLWHVTLVNDDNGDRDLLHPHFIVRAKNHEEAAAKVEAVLCREEFPLPLMPCAEVVEFEFEDVAWL